MEHVSEGKVGVMPLFVAITQDMDVRFEGEIAGVQDEIKKLETEAGVDLVTVTLAGSEAGGAGNNWDDQVFRAPINP